jgi:origin recognition complex subunit 4
MLEAVLSGMSRQHKEEFHAVRLNGFIHTDDKLALKEIWRQLGKEMEVEDELISKVSRHASGLSMYGHS